MTTRPFIPEGTEDISWMLGDLGTLGRATESIVAGSTEVASSWAKTENVEVGVQAQRDPVRGTEVDRMYGREVMLSHLLFFLIDLDVEVGDFFKLTTGPYAGQHLRITFRVSYPGSHHECDAIYDPDHTAADTLG